MMGMAIHPQAGPNAAVFPCAHSRDKKTHQCWVPSALGTELRCLGDGSGPSHGLSQGDEGLDQEQAREQDGVLGHQLRTKPGAQGLGQDQARDQARVLGDSVRTKAAIKPGCLGTSWGPSQGAQGLNQDQTKD